MSTGPRDPGDRRRGPSARAPSASRTSSAWSPGSSSAGSSIWAGAAKVGKPLTSERAVQAYEIFPMDLAGWIGLALPFVEVVLGVLLVLGLFTRPRRHHRDAAHARLHRRHLPGLGAWADHRLRVLRRGRTGRGRRDRAQEIARDGASSWPESWLCWRPRVPRIPRPHPVRTLKETPSHHGQEVRPPPPRPRGRPRSRPPRSPRAGERTRSSSRPWWWSSPSSRSSPGSSGPSRARRRVTGGGNALPPGVSALGEAARRSPTWPGSRRPHRGRLPRLPVPGLCQLRGSARTDDQRPRPAGHDEARLPREELPRRQARERSSTRAGNGAFCAADAGSFEEYHEQVFPNQPVARGTGSPMPS